MKQERLQLDPTRSNSMKSISTARSPVKRKMESWHWELDAAMAGWDAEP